MPVANPNDEINNQTPPPPNTSQHGPNALPPGAQMCACERATHTSFILVLKQCMILTWDNQRHLKYMCIVIKR